MKYLAFFLLTLLNLPQESLNQWPLAGDEAINNVEKWLSDRGMYLKKKSAKSVLPSSYRPELDDTKYLDQEHVSYYQEQIGVLRWMVELGRYLL